MKRLDWIDIAKGIGIVLVVLGHSRLNAGFVGRWISSFHMPLFFILAGICYDEMRYPSYLAYAKRKLIALAYPYFTLSLIVIAMFSMLYMGNDSAYDAKTLFLNGTLKGSTFGAFWFITSLFCVEICYAGFSRIVISPVFRTIIMLLVSLSAALFIQATWPYFLDTTLMAMFFYAFGHILRLFLSTGANARLKYICGVGIGVGMVHILWLMLVYRYKATFVSHDLGDPLCYFLSAILGSVFIILVSCAISKCEVRVLSLAKLPFVFLGKNTIVILATHNAIGVCRQSWLGRMPYMNGVTSVLLELILMGTLLWLFAEPCRFLIDFNVLRQLIRGRR